MAAIYKDELEYKYSEKEMRTQFLKILVEPGVSS